MRMEAVQQEQQDRRRHRHLVIPAKENPIYLLRAPQMVPARAVKFPGGQKKPLELPEAVAASKEERVR